MICGNSSVVSGFLINGGSCSRVDDQLSLDFHSVGDFKEWIEEKVSGAEKLVGISMLFVIFTVLFTIKNSL